jgi:hypothetical protein
MITLKKALLKKDNWKNGRYRLPEYNICEIRLDSNKNKAKKWFNKISYIENEWYGLIVHLPEKPPIDIPIILFTEKDD